MAQPLISDQTSPSSHQRMIVELKNRLDQAEAVLTALRDAKREAESQCAEFKRADAMKSVTGTSAIERAIAATSRIIDLLKREIAESRRGLPLTEVRRGFSGEPLSLVV
jgi:uncharacterized protein YhaN